MTRNITSARLATAAIAAALAVPFNPALAQDASGAPLTIEIPDVAPAPTSDPLAPATEIDVAPIETPSTMAEPEAPAPAIKAASKARPAAETAKPEPVQAQAPMLDEPASAEPVDTPTTDISPLGVDLSATTVEEPAVAESSRFDWAPIAMAAIFSLLALVGILMMLRRRKSAPIVDAPIRGHETPHATDERPLFQWNKPSTAAPTRSTYPTLADAERGPSPANPSLSRKRRIKRANFFAQREQQVAQGKAAPVSPFAGLPQRLVDTLQEAGKPARRIAFETA